MVSVGGTVSGVGTSGGAGVSGGVAGGGVAFAGFVGFFLCDLFGLHSGLQYFCAELVGVKSPPHVSHFLSFKKSPQSINDQGEYKRVYSKNENGLESRRLNDRFGFSRWSFRNTVINSLTRKPLLMAVFIFRTLTD